MNATLFDAGMLPLERAGLARWRRRLWALLPDGGLGLEVGAGTGANFGLHPPGARVVAVDASPALLRAARRKSRSADVLLVACDVQDLPFRDGTFDWAAETLVFCEVRDPAAGMAEVARVLPPGAPFALLEHVRPAGWLGRLADLLSRLTAALWGEHFDRSPLPALQAAGFTPLQRASFLRDIMQLLVCRRGAASTDEARAAD